MGIAGFHPRSWVSGFGSLCLFSHSPFANKTTFPETQDEKPGVKVIAPVKEEMARGILRTELLQLQERGPWGHSARHLWTMGPPCSPITLLI